MNKIPLNHFLRTILIVMAWITSLSIYAKKYVIVRLWNCKTINIGGKNLKKGDTFDGKSTINWTNARQLIEVKELHTNKVIKVTGMGFEKQNTTNLSDMLIRQNSLGHRSFNNKELYYKNTDYYLTDSLHIPTLDPVNSSNIAEAVWLNKGKEVVTPISRTTDGKFYIITKKIYKNNPPKDVLIDIRERDMEIDWENNIYSGIAIKFIPKKL